MNDKPTHRGNRQAFLDGYSSKNRKRRTFGGLELVVAAIFGFIVLGMISALAAQIAIHHHNESYANCVVTGKDRTSTKNSSEMRIYTENCGTFKVADITLRGRFDSADVYGRIIPNHTYDFEAMGYRLPFFSEFPNITKAVEK